MFVCLCHFFSLFVHVEFRLAATVLLGAVPAVLAAHFGVSVALVDQNATTGAASVARYDYVFYTLNDSKLGQIIIYATDQELNAADKLNW